MTAESGEGRVATLDQALDLVDDGAIVATGGSPLARKPVAALRGLAGRGLRNLELVTFTGSIDVGLLLGAGALRAVRASSVSLGEAGRARAFEAAVAADAIEDLEESEWMLLGRLRAGAAGMPFLPTRAAIGSDLLAARDLRWVEDPYTGEELVAIPALRPDVALIHAWRGDADGNVQVPFPPDHLWDVDVLMARAARNVVVTVEEVVGHDEIKRSPQLTVLFGFEVDAIIESPGGASPTALNPSYSANLEAVACVDRENVACIETHGAN